MDDVVDAHSAMEQEIVSRDRDKRRRDAKKEIDKVLRGVANP
ncbi:hypothetical protein Aaci_2231 [Alicyclobacillus acidocaldarius subsp. acidocaldarius DSM 446]|uniref:Uncharacterized protein n=1 Tax=Alicyclobacillus acidocaldarius subsp. acidocaldarius (strain ATCC 27009 / DSM 446 / BCRC 14685 / JCM 5260 / KCTC 1825 / NBRC 15652 / NCIMB 11725 / NRRL B-14509 / 104-IA) TaxID=521098 RepID=C8WR71_ALIAD|nr:hypothetical protein Aaci_2231 [Alicyclobacillus acidocaldarius subsp. acidocaldarius DSM 446]